MAMCPGCKAPVGENETTCPTCGHAIPASSLEDVQTQTTGWQKFIIAVVIVLLVAIAFTFYNAQSREDRATQQIFEAQMGQIAQSVAIQSGLAQRFGMPAYRIVAEPKAATATLVFPSGPLTQSEAAMYGRGVCIMLAQAYVKRGYIPRSLRVVVSGNQPGGQALYGQAVFNGNLGATYSGNIISSPGDLTWVPASN